MEYLIKTYTNEGDVVLDFTMGSGSTGVACINTNRRFIGIDLVEFNINFGRERMNHYLETGETYIPKNLLEEKDIDVNYYKIKGKHINNP
jgi:DNA modification methylase